MRSTHLRGLALLEESVLASLLGSLVLGEVASLASLLHDGVIDTSDIHLGRGRNDVPGVYPSEGNAVNFEGTSDEEDTLLEVLEDDNTLATEATSEEDDDGTGSEGRANLGRADGLASLESLSVLLFILASILGVLCGFESPCAVLRAMQHVDVPIRSRLQSTPPLHRTPCILSKTYLLGHSDVLSRVVFAGLLGVVRYRPLALGKLLRSGLVRHVELCVVSLKP